MGNGLASTGLGRTFEFEFSDADGFSFEGSFRFVLGPVDKVLDGTDPGYAQMSIDYEAGATLTNTTPDRSVEVTDVGSLTILLPNEVVPLSSLCMAADNALGTPFCRFDLEIRSDQEGTAGGRLDSGMSVSALSGPVLDQPLGIGQYEEPSVNAIRAYLDYGQVAGYQLTIGTDDNRTGLIFNADLGLVGTCQVAGITSLCV